MKITKFKKNNCKKLTCIRTVINTDSKKINYFAAFLKKFVDLLQEY